MLHSHQSFLKISVCSVLFSLSKLMSIVDDGYTHEKRGVSLCSGDIHLMVTVNKSNKSQMVFALGPRFRPCHLTSTFVGYPRFTLKFKSLLGFEFVLE